MDFSYQSTGYVPRLIGFDRNMEMPRFYVLQFGLMVGTNLDEMNLILGFMQPKWNPKLFDQIGY